MYKHRWKTEAESTPAILKQENESWVGTSVSAGCLCTAVQSRGRGVDIAEVSCTETEWIGQGLQTSTHLNLPRGGGVDSRKHSESYRRCLASPK
jgi:hypothetical protein